MSVDTAIAASLREICDELKAGLPPGQGFAFFIEGDVDDTWSYASNADRQDVRAMLVDWLARTSDPSARPPGATTEKRDRLAALCTEVGTIIHLAGSGILLFLFDRSHTPGPGDLAYFTNRPTASRAVVHRWLRDVRPKGN